MKKYILLVFLSCFGCFSGQKINLDSLIYKTEFLIYKDPNAAIRIINDYIKKEKDPAKLVRTYLILANIYIAKRDFDQSLIYSAKAQEISKQLNSPKQEISVLSAISVQYQQMGLYNKCIESLDKCDQILDRLMEDNFKFFQLGRNFAIRGMVYKSQDNSEIALDKFLTSVSHFKKATQGKATKANLSIVYYNIAYCYFDLKNTAKAVEYFKNSYQLAAHIDAKSLEAYALKGLAETYSFSENHTESINLLAAAESKAKSVGDLTLNEGIYKGLSNGFLVLKDMKKHQFYNELYNKTKFEREQSELKSINQIIDVSTKKHEDLSKEIQKKYTAIWIIILLICSLVMVALIFLILKKRNQNKILQKEIINLSQQ